MQTVCDPRDCRCSGCPNFTWCFHRHAAALARPWIGFCRSWCNRTFCSNRTKHNGQVVLEIRAPPIKWTRANGGKARETPTRFS